MRGRSCRHRRAACAARAGDVAPPLSSQLYSAVIVVRGAGLFAQPGTSLSYHIEVCRISNHCHAVLRA